MRATRLFGSEPQYAFQPSGVERMIVLSAFAKLRNLAVVPNQLQAKGKRILSRSMG